jgi:MoxR-like ATPase
MEDRLFQLYDKKVQLSLPYVDQDTPLIGRERELDHLMAAFMRISNTAVEPEYPLLLGEPGVGKNKLVYTLARILRQDLYVFQGGEEAYGDDLICSTRMSDDLNKKVDYVLSSLATAMILGKIFYLDELGKTRHKALSPLASLLEERNYVDSIVLGERIKARPGFRFVAGCNPSDFEREALPDFLQSRAKPIIKMGHLTQREIEQIIRSRYRILSENGTALFKCFWDLWKEKKKDQMVNPRASVQIYGRAIQFAHLEGWRSNPAEFLEYQGEPRSIRKEHLEAAFEGD